MPFPMKVQPIDSEAFADSSTKPVTRSRLKRLFDRQFTNVLRSSAADKGCGGGGGGEFVYGGGGAGGGGEFEPSSVALDKMVRNFIEDNEKTPAMSSATRYGKNRCNCFNRSSNDSSDDEFEFDFGFSDSKSSFSDSSDSLKSLIPCSSKAERNLLADTSKIVEKNRGKRKDDLVKIVIESLVALSYDAALCKSKWEKSSSVPAGEYDYIDVIIDAERILIDVDFRSEFEIARSTGTYKAILQSLPLIFVGKSDRLSQIIAIAAEGAKHSLKKKGMHVAPWRKVDYIRSKWLGNFKRIEMDRKGVDVVAQEEVVYESCGGGVYEGGELDLIFGEKTTSFEVDCNSVVSPETSVSGSGQGERKTMSFEVKCNSVGIPETLVSGSGEGEKEATSFEVNSNSVAPSEEVSGEGEKLDFSVKVPWQPPVVKLNNNKAIVTGLASLLKEKFES